MAVSNIVESIEYIELSFGTDDTTNSGFLTKGQNYQNCVPFMTTHSQNDNVDAKLFDTYFSGTTTSGVINFNRSATRTSTATVKCYVVEFNPTEVDVQQGSFSITATNTTDNVTLPTTLSGVDKTAMVFTWETDTTSAVLSNSLIKGEVVTVSGLEFYRGQTLDNCSGHWFTFEDRGNNFTVTHIDGSYTIATSGYSTISGTHCIDPNRTFLLGSAANSNDSTYASRTTSVAGLSSDGKAKSALSASAAGTAYWNCQIIEFIDTTKVYTPVSQSFLSLNVNGASPQEINFFPPCNTATTTPIVASMQGIGSTATSSQFSNGNLFWSYEVTDTGTITVEFLDDISATITAPYITAVDWAGITVSSGTNSNVIPEGSGVNQSFVKSVENISVSMTEDEVNMFLSKGQNWRNCVIFSSCRATTDNSEIRNHLVNVYFTDEGVLHLKRPPTTLDRVVELSVVEFWPEQVKVQHKRVFTDNTATTTVPIDPVSSIDKCFITHTIYPSDSTYYTRDVLPRVSFATVSGVDLYIYNNAATSYHIDVSFFVVEDLGSNFVVSHNSSSFLSTKEDVYYDDTTHYNKESVLPIFNYTNDQNSSYPNRVSCCGYYSYEYAPLVAYKFTTVGTMYWQGMAIRFLGNKRYVYNAQTEFTTAIDTLTGNYDSDLVPNEHALSCIGTMQGPTFTVGNTGTASRNSMFCTAKITDTVSGIYEVSRSSSTDYDALGGISVINWIGYIPSSSGTNIKTNSMVMSIQSEFDSNSYYDTYFEIPLTKGQNITQCVPFVTNSCAFTASYIYSTNFYKAVYRYEDKFLIRFASPREHSKYVANRDVSIHIVEFNDNVTIQYGVVSTSDLSTAVNINSVNLDRSFLLFYHTVDDYDTNGNRSATVCGRFSSASELSFIRNFNAGNMTISWYVVECSEEADYWTVTHNYSTGLGGGGTVSIPLDRRPDINKSLFFASWAVSGSSSSYVTRSTYKARHSYNDTAVLTKNDNSTYNMDYCNVEVVEFTDGIHSEGLRVIGIDASFTTGTSTDVVINTVSGSSFDLSRSISWNMNAGNENEVVTNATDVWQNVYLSCKFKDGDTLTLTRGYTNYTTELFPFVCEFPEYNKYYMEGYVKEDGVPVVREVISFRKSTNKITDRTNSVSGTGYFLLETPYGEEHYIVAFDDDAGETYNDLIYGQLQPTVISGTFAYNEGLVTTSGFNIGVPLARQ